MPAAAQEGGVTESIGKALSKVLEVIQGIFSAITMGEGKNLMILGRVLIFVVIVVVFKATKDLAKKGKYSNEALDQLIPLLGVVIAFLTAVFVSEGYVAAILYLFIFLGETLPLLLLGYWGYKLSQGGTAGKESWQSALFKSIAYFIIGMFLLGFAGGAKADLLNKVAFQIGARYTPGTEWWDTSYGQDNVFTYMAGAGFAILGAVDSAFGTFFDLLNVIVILMACWEFIHFLQLVGSGSRRYTSITSGLSGRGYTIDQEEDPQRLAKELSDENKKLKEIIQKYEDNKPLSKKDKETLDKIIKRNDEEADRILRETEEADEVEDKINRILTERTATLPKLSDQLNKINARFIR
jgi:hypothetical protein